MSCCIARSNTLRFKIRNFTLRLFAAQRVPLDAGDRIRHARLLYVARPGASLLGAGKADSGALHARGARTDRGRPDTQGRRFEWGAARRDVCAAAVKDVRAECSRPCTHALAFHICVMAVVYVSLLPRQSYVFRASTAQDADIFERCPHSSLSV